jgi:hypothetical protein
VLAGDVIALLVVFRVIDGWLYGPLHRFEVAGREMGGIAVDVAVQRSFPLSLRGKGRGSGSRICYYGRRHSLDWLIAASRSKKKGRSRKRRRRRRRGLCRCEVSLYLPFVGPALLELDAATMIILLA